MLKTASQGSGAASHFCSVQDKDDRRLQEFGNLSGATGFLIVGGTVVKSHDSLNNSYVRIGSHPGKVGPDAISGQHPGVEVAARPTRGQTVVTWVNVVGANLP